MAYNQFDWSGGKQRYQGGGYGNPLYNPSGSAQNTTGTSWGTQQAMAEQLSPGVSQFANSMGPASTNDAYGKPDLGPGSWGGSKDTAYTTPQGTNSYPQPVGAGTPQTNQSPYVGPQGPGQVGHQWQQVYDYSDPFRRPEANQTMAPTGGAPAGNFKPLPNFDQNGRIVSIPNGVSWGVPDAGGSPDWIYNGATSFDQPIPGFGNPAAGTPIGQYTGAMPPNPYVNTPSNPLGATPWLGVGAFRA